MTKRMDAKNKALAEHGALNPRPQNVAQPLFQFNEFFDPYDLVQVKYEMLRQVRVDGQTVTETAAAFGFSRPAFYRLRRRSNRMGCPAWFPSGRVRVMPTSSRRPSCSSSTSRGRKTERCGLRHWRT